MTATNQHYNSWYSDLRSHSLCEDQGGTESTLALASYSRNKPLGQTHSTNRAALRKDDHTEAYNGTQRMYKIRTPAKLCAGPRQTLRQSKVARLISRYGSMCPGSSSPLLSSIPMTSPSSMPLLDGRAARAARIVQESAIYSDSPYRTIQNGQVVRRSCAISEQSATE